MSFVVRLTTDLIQVDAGSTTALSYEVVNDGPESDLLEISIEGVDPDWFSIPEASVNVGSKATVSDKIFVRPLRSPENAAGTYPFILKARSLNSGDSSSTKGVIEINAFHQVSLDVEPKKLTLSGTAKQTEFTLKVLNLSNVEHTLQVYGSDPDNQVSFVFEPDKVEVGPGQEREINAICKLNKNSVISGSKLFGLSFSARSANFPTVAAYSHSQLEKRPIISPATLVMIMMIFAVLLLWVQALPKSPGIEVFDIQPGSVHAGEEITVVWRVNNAEKILITAEDGQTKTEVSDKGEWKFTTEKADPDFTIKIEAFRGGKKSFTERTIQVDAPIEALQPKIREFSISPTSVNDGEEVKVKFKFNDAVTSAELLPGGYKLDITDDSFSFVPNWEGDMEVKLVAMDANGNRDDRTVKVTVVKKSVAKILSFSAAPMSVNKTDGLVTFTWSIENATQAELIIEGKSNPISATSGTQSFSITKSGTVKLIAIDSNGKKVVQTLAIKVIEDLPTDPVVKDPPKDPDPSLDDPASAGGGTTSGKTTAGSTSGAPTSGGTTPPNR